MSKYNINISGNSRIGSIAIGNGAVAIGSVNVAQDHVAYKCDHCGAPVDQSRKDCEFCNTPYPIGVGANIDSISISTVD